MFTDTDIVPKKLSNDDKDTYKFDSQSFLIKHLTGK